MTRVQQVINKIKADVTDKQVIEIACGRADFSIEAAKTAASVHCIDLDSFRLNDKIHEYANIVFQQMDATTLEYGNEVFDTAVIYNALFHLETVLEKVLSEALRVVRTGGSVWFISSFSMDKNTMEEKLFPLLSASNLEYAASTDKVFTYVRIHKPAKGEKKETS